MAQRQFVSSIEIAAPKAVVWDLVGDVANAPKWSNHAIKVKPFGGATRKGTFAINLNKEGLALWPTTSKVVDFAPGERIANKVINQTVWVFELEEGAGGPGTTRLTEYCEYPDALLTFYGRTLPKLTGGRAQFIKLQDKGVSSSLRKIKDLAEKRAGGA